MDEWHKQKAIQKNPDNHSRLELGFSTFFLNSLLVTVGAIIGNLVSCSLAAYALARLQFRGRRLAAHDSRLDLAILRRDVRHIFTAGDPVGAGMA